MRHSMVSAQNPQVCRKFVVRTTNMACWAGIENGVCEFGEKFSVLWKTMEDVASRRGFHQQNIPLFCGARCSTNQHFIMRCHYIDVFQVLVNKAQFAAQRFPTLLFHNTGMVLIVSCAMNVCASSIQRLVGSLLSITEAATRHQNRHLS